MALWQCTDCTCRFAVGAVRCPQCGGTDYVEDGAEGMAKITVHGGATNALLDSEERSEGSSPGTSSSTSSAKQPASRSKSGSGGRSPARTTGSRSGRDRTETSTARPTDGDQADAESETGSTASDT